MKNTSVDKCNIQKRNCNDLLNSENGKNDDSWLVTPPGSPCPSLDVNGLLPINCSPMKKGDKIQSMSTTNSSSERLHPQSKRKFASSSTPSTTTRSSTPNKSLISTPSLKTSDLISSDLYGFSSDTPSNLRTNPFDRSSLQRLTPISRNRGESYSKSRRLPMKSLATRTTTKKQSVKNQTMGFSKNASRTPPSSPSSNSINLGQINKDNGNMVSQKKFKRPIMSKNAKFSKNSSPETKTSECKVLGPKSDNVHEQGVENKINPNKYSLNSDDIVLDEVKTKEIMVEPQPRSYSIFYPDDATSVTDSNEKISNCTFCWKSFQTAEIDSGNKVICQECALKDELFRELLMVESASSSSQIMDGMSESINSNKSKHSSSFTTYSNTRDNENDFKGLLKSSIRSKEVVSTDANRSHSLNNSNRSSFGDHIKNVMITPLIKDVDESNLGNSSSSSLDLGSSKQMVSNVESQKVGMDSLIPYLMLQSPKSLFSFFGDHIKSPTIPKMIENVDEPNPSNSASSSFDFGLSKKIVSHVESQKDEIDCLTTCSRFQSAKSLLPLGDHIKSPKTSQLIENIGGSDLRHSSSSSFDLGSSKQMVPHVESQKDEMECLTTCSRFQFAKSLLPSLGDHIRSPKTPQLNENIDGSNPSNSSSSSLDLGSSKQMVSNVESWKDGIDCISHRSMLQSAESLLSSLGDHIKSPKTSRLIENIDGSDLRHFSSSSLDLGSSKQMVPHVESQKDEMECLTTCSKFQFAKSLLPSLGDHIRSPKTPQLIENIDGSSPSNSSSSSFDLDSSKQMVANVESWKDGIDCSSHRSRLQSAESLLSSLGDHIKSPKTSRLIENINGSDLRHSSSSSLDLGSSKQMVPHVESQKDEMECLTTCSKFQFAKSLLPSLGDHIRSPKTPQLIENIDGSSPSNSSSSSFDLDSSKQMVANVESWKDGIDCSSHRSRLQSAESLLSSLGDHIKSPKTSQLIENIGGSDLRHSSSSSFDLGSSKQMVPHVESQKDEMECLTTCSKFQFAKSLLSSLGDHIRSPKTPQLIENIDGSNPSNSSSSSLDLGSSKQMVPNVESWKDGIDCSSHRSRLQSAESLLSSLGDHIKSPKTPKLIENIDESNSSHSSSSSLGLGSSIQIVPNVESWKEGMDCLSHRSRLQSAESLLSSFLGDHIKSPKKPQIIGDIDESDLTPTSFNATHHNNLNNNDNHEDTTISCCSIVNEMVQKVVEIETEKEQLHDEDLNAKIVRKRPSKSSNILKKVTNILRKIQNMIFGQCSHT
ncbi:hypothetical protein ZOSMA_2G00600 [Zostera marina]|uniref:Uncharacterized protein n=1 Tax=Zostera marina TaxID=29655 RepID=A0A0K9PAD1_ZOSMR|nr:hypothetical protein ZOSMA_2G00600 [Zostera marina]